MNKKIVNEIKALYDTDNEKYSYNKKFSGGGKAVFTRPDKPYEWLTISYTDLNIYMATRSDDGGFITNRELYEVDGKEINCVYKESFEMEPVSLRSRLKDAKIISKANKPRGHGKEDVSL